MDSTRFDHLARMLTVARSRRSAVRLLGVGLMAGLSARRAVEPALAAQGELRCSEGRYWCFDHCAPLLTDRNNCGSCGNVCWEHHACQNGTCVHLSIVELPAPTWPIGPPLEAPLIEP